MVHQLKFINPLYLVEKVSLPRSLAAATGPMVAFTIWISEATIGAPRRRMLTSRTITISEVVSSSWTAVSTLSLTAFHAVRTGLKFPRFKSGEILLAIGLFDYLSFCGRGGRYFLEKVS